ncbi:MAG: ATP-binding cassette domain-containing protein [bacterium]|nr:ATP-binding cassette domain-containing protein [bacterium]
MIFNGAIFGIVIGLLAMGIVLTFRSTKVINFAVGNLGLIGGALFPLLILQYNFPFWVAAGLVLVMGALFGGIIELIVIRRLFRSPRVIVLVATVGVAQLCQVIPFTYPDLDVKGVVRYPVVTSASWHPFEGLGMSEAQLWTVLAAPAAIAAAGWALLTLRPPKSRSGWRTMWLRVWLGGLAATAGLLALIAGGGEPKGLRIAGAQLTILVVVPLIAFGLYLVLNRTWFGRNVAASAENADLSRLAGVNPKIVSTFVWVLAGLISTVAIVLLSGQSGSISGVGGLGPTTLARAMVAAAIAGMTSFPRAMAAGIYLGIIEFTIRFNLLGHPGLFDFLLLIAVLVAVAMQRGQRLTTESFSFTPKIPPIPSHLRQIWWVRHMNRLALGAGLLALALVPLVVTQPSRQFAYASVLAFALCASSLTVVTGWSGQVSLAQMSFAGIGALFAAALVRGLEMDFWFIDFNAAAIPFAAGLFIAPIAMALVATVVGVGALRVQGLMLAVTTLVLAIASMHYIYRRPIFSDGNVRTVPFLRGDLFGIDLASQRNYYYFCLVLLVVVLYVLTRLRRSGVGRGTIAVRDNIDAALAYTVSSTRMKLSAFALAGGIVGLGGAVLAGLAQNIPLTERFFTVDDSIRLVGIVVIGGLGTIIGPVLGALWIEGLPSLFDSRVLSLFVSSIGLLLVVMYFPGGFAQVIYSWRSSALRWAEARYGLSAPPKGAQGSVRLPPSHRIRDDSGHAVLETDDLSVAFGGNQALDGASLSIPPNRIVGLIGTNGAGKSTFMNAVGGFVPAVGEVRLNGTDISRLAPHRRAMLGLGRTFQGATLFPELTVRETIQVALEARERTPFFATAASLPSSIRFSRAQRNAADEIIDFLGLGRYGDSYVGDLSTGTRRIVEIGGLLALDAHLLCLDEPTAGVAQREAEAFGPLLVSINSELQSSMLIIEHDMPLIMSVSDHVYCLEAGQVIADGTPDQVRSDPRVVASYLGTDDRAIARSDL